MRSIHIVAVAGAGERVTPESLNRLDRLSAGLARTLRVSCRVRTEAVEGRFALDETRGQYNSTAILTRLAAEERGPGVVLLGVAAVDLFVPILKYLFGEAQLGGDCALVSYHRLREEFYGLPGDEERLEQRLLKEAMHEIGHTQGLAHCDDWRCAMASTHAVEIMDAKYAAFCPECREVFRTNGGLPARP